MKEEDKWSEEETAILIEAYRNKWYYLKLGNLSDSHWQEVADEVMARCNTHKTSRQCGHQMKYLRNCYRREIQRALNPKPQMYPYAWVDTWVHFHRMDFMENGYWLLDHDDADPVMQDDDEQEGDGENQEIYNSWLQTKNPGQGSGSGQVFGSGQGSGSGQGFGSSQCLGGGCVEGGFGFGKTASGDGGNSVEEMVAPMETLDDGFVRMKMDEAREVVAKKGKEKIHESN